METLHYEMNLQNKIHVSSYTDYSDWSMQRVQTNLIRLQYV